MLALANRLIPIESAQIKELRSRAGRATELN
jgi:hypothetical protein